MPAPRSVDRAHRDLQSIEAIVRARPTVDSGPPKALSRPPRPPGAHNARKVAEVEAAMADIRMIGNIAKEMSRVPSLSVLERRGPTTLNAGRRRTELRRIDVENEKMLKRLETAKSSYPKRDHQRSYDQSRRHVALASAAAARGERSQTPTGGSAPPQQLRQGGPTALSRLCSPRAQSEAPLHQDQEEQEDGRDDEGWSSRSSYVYDRDRPRVTASLSPAPSSRLPRLSQPRGPPRAPKSRMPSLPPSSGPPAEAELKLPSLPRSRGPSREPKPRMPTGLLAGPPEPGGPASGSPGAASSSSGARRGEQSQRRASRSHETSPAPPSRAVSQHASPSGRSRASSRRGSPAHGSQIGSPKTGAAAAGSPQLEQAGAAAVPEAAAPGAPCAQEPEAGSAADPDFEGSAGAESPALGGSRAAAAAAVAAPAPDPAARRPRSSESQEPAEERPCTAQSGQSGEDFDEDRPGTADSEGPLVSEERPASADIAGPAAASPCHVGSEEPRGAPRAEPPAPEGSYTMDLTEHAEDRPSTAHSEVPADRQPPADEAGALAQAGPGTAGSLPRTEDNAYDDETYEEEDFDAESEAEGSEGGSFGTCAEEEIKVDRDDEEEDEEGGASGAMSRSASQELPRVPEFARSISEGSCSMQREPEEFRSVHGSDSERED